MEKELSSINIRFPENIIILSYKVSQDGTPKKIDQIYVNPGDDLSNYEQKVIDVCNAVWES